MFAMRHVPWFGLVWCVTCFNGARPITVSSITTTKLNKGMITSEEHAHIMRMNALILGGCKTSGNLHFPLPAANNLLQETDGLLRPA